MIGVYFSGTGNTEYCIKKFMSVYAPDSFSISIENTDIADFINQHREIVFAYPIYYSNLPKIVRDFITQNRTLWYGKKIFIIATMGLFSGDGTGLSARLLKKYGAYIVGGLHIKMPDCICDVRTLKRSISKNQEIVNNATDNLTKAAQLLQKGSPPQEGLNIFCHVAGLFGQRLWCYNKTRSYTDQSHINLDACIGCGKCVRLCPMKNISVIENKAQSCNHCTMCYRCISQCPQKAITLIGKKVIEQYSITDFL